MAVTAQQPEEGHSGSQTEEVMKGQIEGAHGRVGTAGRSGQLGQGKFQVGRVQIRDQRGAGPAGLQDSLRGFAGQIRMRHSAPPGIVTLPGFDPDKDRHNRLDVRQIGHPGRLF